MGTPLRGGCIKYSFCNERYERAPSIDVRLHYKRKKRLSQGALRSLLGGFFYYSRFNLCPRQEASSSPKCARREPAFLWVLSWFFPVSSAGIEPAFPPSEGDVLSIIRRGRNRRLWDTVLVRSKNRSRIIHSPTLMNFRDPGSRFRMLAKHRSAFLFLLQAKQLACSSPPTAQTLVRSAGIEPATLRTAT